MKDKQRSVNIPFESIFRSCPDLYLLLSPNLMIVDASDAYLNATVTLRCEITGHWIFDIFPDNPGDPDANGVFNLRSSLHTVLATRQPHTMPIQKYDISRPDGIFEERYWKPVNTPVINELNEVIYIIHRVEDVTEQQRIKTESEKEVQKRIELEASERKYQENLKQSEALFFKIFNLIPVATYITEIASGKLMYVNNAFEYLFQLKNTDAIGKNFIDLNFIDEKKRQEVAKEIVEKNGLIGYEITLRTSMGEKRHVLMSVEIMELDDKKCFLVSMIDITDRKKMEDAILNLNKELESFGYSVSHDLRTPLRAVAGYAQIMEEDYASVLDNEGRRLLNTISHNAEKMGHLIDDLLKFSRLGKKELQMKNTSLQKLVENVFADLNKSTQHNAKVITNVTHHVNADENMLKLAIMNLISNSIKYSSKKTEPIITIRSTLVNNEIIFSVADNGAGFDMRYVDKLFGVFQRLHSVEEFEGTGVGLAIVYRIITKHGGRVWAEGKVDEGATLYFSIPQN